jgi:hypothetical protein
LPHLRPAKQRRQADKDDSSRRGQSPFEDKVAEIFVKSQQSTAGLPRLIKHNIVTDAGIVLGNRINIVPGLAKHMDNRRLHVLVRE